MALHLACNNPAPKPADPIPWECAECGGHSISFIHTGATQLAGKLIFEIGVAVMSDQAHCACCGNQVAHQVEGKGWLTISGA